MTSQLESLGSGLARRRRFLMESATREAWGHITRTVVVFIAAFVAGALIFLWMFEAAFANASPSVYDAWIFPLAVLFGACLLLALIEPNPWVITAAASFPALAVTSFLMVSLWLEGRNDWHWPAVIVTVVLCSGAGAFSGSWLRTRK